MITPQFTIQVRDTGVRLVLDRLPKTLKSNLVPVVSELTQAMLERARGAEPSRTGQLRAHTRAFLDVTETMIRGRVRVLGSAAGPAIAAAALEYGAHRTFPVSAYARRGFLVLPYMRTANITARWFLRNTALSIRDQALARMTAAVDKSVKEAAVP